MQTSRPYQGIRDRIHELGLHEEPEVLEEMLGFFMDSVSDLVVRLEQAVLAGDFDAIQTGAHTLKGVSANLGAVRMRSLSQRVDELARAGVLVGLEDLVRDLGGELAQIRDCARDPRGWD